MAGLFSEYRLGVNHVFRLIKVYTKSLKMNRISEKIAAD